VATPFIGSAPGSHTLGSDGYTDLVLEYDLAEFITTLGLESMEHDEPFSVRVSGQMNKKYASAPILGQDFLAISDDESCPYDLDDDKDVDVVDIMLVAARWNTSCGDPSYNADFDFDADCDIDVIDIMMVAAQWGWLG
ncbi:MAG: hypothetical protein DRH37_06970, partial [Deltaproteobacteria bacterium]